MNYEHSKSAHTLNIPKVFEPFVNFKLGGLKLKKKAEKKKVLVADDDDMTLAMVSLYLTNQGFEVMPAKDSYEAINLIKDFKPDLLLLDILMPFMTGLELLNYIRYEFLIKNIPVIIISAMQNSEVVEAANKLGVTSYLTKPFEMPELIKLIRSIPGFK